MDINIKLDPEIRPYNSAPHSIRTPTQRLEGPSSRFNLPGHIRLPISKALPWLSIFSEGHSTSALSTKAYNRFYQAMDLLPRPLTESQVMMLLGELISGDLTIRWGGRVNTYVERIEEIASDILGEEAGFLPKPVVVAFGVLLQETAVGLQIKDGLERYDPGIDVFYVLDELFGQARREDWQASLYKLVESLSLIHI